jgi:hypothetical protein
VWVVAFASLLAGAGAARILVERASVWRRTVVLIAVLVLVALAPVPAEWRPLVRWGALKAGMAVALVLVVALVMARAAPGSLLRRVAPALLVAGVAADLAVAAWPYLAFVPRSVAVTPPAAALAIIGHRQEALAPPRLYRADRNTVSVRQQAPPGSPIDDEVRLVMTMVPNTSATFGVAALPGYDAAIPVTLPELWIRGQRRGQSVLRLLGIEYAMLPIEDARDPVEHRRGLEPVLDPVPGARLYRVPGALPRVYLAGRAEVMDDEAVLSRLFDDEVVQGGLVLLAPGSTPLAGPTRRAGSCTLVSWANTRIAARCQGDGPALAVFIEQHDAGWSALVDGAPAPLLRANLLMRAVSLPGGTHEVVLSYRPPALGAGLGLSISSALLLLVLACTPLLRRRQAHIGLPGPPS